MSFQGVWWCSRLSHICLRHGLIKKWKKLKHYSRFKATFFVSLGRKLFWTQGIAAPMQNTHNTNFKKVKCKTLVCAKTNGLESLLKSAAATLFLSVLHIHIDEFNGQRDEWALHRLCLQRGILNLSPEFIQTYSELNHCKQHLLSQVVMQKWRYSLQLLCIF